MTKALSRYARLTATNLILIFSLFSTQSFANNEAFVTVQLFEAHRPVLDLELLPPFQIIGSEGKKTVSIKTLAGITNGKVCLRNGTRSDGPAIAIVSSPRILLQGLNLGLITLRKTQSGNHSYHGRILLSVAHDGSLAIENIVSRRDYVNDVVAAEAPLKAPLDMLKAQAVLVQTLLLRTVSAIVGDSTQSQCYLGANLESPAIRSAVASVWGKILTYKGAPAVVYYHSTCAGGTSAAASYFHLRQGSLPYLSAVRCANCQHSPFWLPTRKSIPREEFAKVFGDGVPLILQSDLTSRPLLIKLADGKILSGYDFWIRLGQSFGWDKTPGTRFTLKEGTNKDIIIESTGAGHGVGLCQWGASSLAKTGKNYKEILRYYFTDCEVH